MRRPRPDLNKSIDVEITILVPVDFRYSFGSPPPRCTNPDSPGFSDPGDSSDLDWSVPPEFEQFLDEECGDSCWREEIIEAIEQHLENLEDVPFDHPDL